MNGKNPVVKMRKPMNPTPFNPETDFPPIPFDERHCRAALQLKEAGLPWRPHVGCFVWDREGWIEVPSPFPEKIYFILNLGHFLRLLGSIEDVVQKLVWLPTWHQARQIGAKLGIEDKELSDIFSGSAVPGPGQDLLALYRKIWENLRR
jgi:hypothetical protein